MEHKDAATAFTEPDKAFQHLIDTIHNYLPDAGCDDVKKAYALASEAHKEQHRASGEPYILHPLAVAQILADMKIDTRTITASLLHDVVEDTDYTLDDLKNLFGKEVAFLVDGVTKLSRLNYRTKEDQQLNSMRKMFLAMAKDVRVVVIKLADRLHNMRTLRYMRSDKQKRIAQETLEIFAPLAHRLGIFNIKWELEDLSFRYLEPDKYYDLVDQMKQKRHVREEIINEAIDVLRKALEDAHIQCEINGRPKHFYSIYKKMKYQHKNLDEIFDLMAVRIIVETVRDCYAVLGLVHTMWTPIPGRFKDYIAMPKPNMYQSLHTTVISDSGKPFEIQIRTYEMHRIAEYGIAAHWKYKEGIVSDREEVKLSWLRQALEWQKDVKDPKEFMESLKMDLFSSQVFVFTPQGDVIELPAGSTPLDFAFKIHSDVGCKCVGARVNGKMVTIDHQLENGNIVEIVTSPNSAGPSIDWLKIAKSSSARNKIRQWLKKENRSDLVDRGKDLLDKYIRKKGHDPRELLKSAFITRAVKEFGYKNSDELYNQLSGGGTLLNKLMNSLLKSDDEAKEIEAEKERSLIENLHEMSEKTIKRNQHNRQKREDNSGIVVDGVDNLMIRIARCCNPVPGDDIVGFITKGRGISVHRKDCDNLKSLSPAEKARFIDVSWGQDILDKSFDTEICIIAKDQKSMLSSISKICEDMDVHISGLNAKAEKDETVKINLTLSIQNKNQMEKICRSLKGIPGIMEAYRTTT